MYIDTSCLGSYYMQEVHTQKVQSILLTDDSPIISSLTEVEFHSMLHKKHRMHHLNSSQQKRIIDKFNDHLRAGLFEILPINESVFHTARWVLSKTEQPLRTLDSLHLAFSITNQLSLFSTDKVLLDAAIELKVDVVSGIE
ncbi:MAG: type II toxin-antitoxin system VapC family toxin [Balneolaceae bacterium]